MNVNSIFRIPRLTGRAWKVWLRNKDVFMKTYKVNFIPPFIEPLLYLFALGFGLGLYVGKFEGISYAAYIAPALVAISSMYSAFFECTFGSYVRMYYQKTFDAIIATPLAIDEVIAGELLWGATKSAINCSIILFVIFMFRLVNPQWAILVVPFSFLSGILFAALAMCFTAIVPNIDSFNYPTYLLITPMFLFSGTFFPISILPTPIRIVAEAFLPLTHVVRILRGLTLATLGWDMFYSLIWIVVVAFMLFVLSINLMHKRLVI
jgi:lipooligosaccharide transport system permease protein